MNLLNKLTNDELYQKILSQMPESEKSKIDEYIKQYIKYWEDDFFSPLENLIEDQNFINEVSKILTSKIDNKKE